MIKIKPGAVISTWTDEMWVAATVVQQVWQDQELPECPWISCGRNGVHSTNSYHYFDLALDFRTKNITNAKRKAYVDEVRRRLVLIDKLFEVFFESIGTPNEHMHIEYNARKRPYV